MTIRSGESAQSDVAEPFLGNRLESPQPKTKPCGTSGLAAVLFHTLSPFSDQGALPMKSRMLLPALFAVGVLCLASASNASAFELLNRLMYSGGGAGCGCDNVCGCDAAPACGCDNGCGRARCCLDRCRERCRKIRCCENTCGCEPKCGAPAPSCGCGA